MPECKSGGELLVQSLINLGAKKSFGVPGESYLAVLDALYDVQEQHQFILCRNEGGAAYMAAAYGKLTRSPGICFVTRGPGATNAAIGVHTAFQDSVPMLLFIGQVGTDMQGREAFQEIDYRAMYAPVAKWVTQVEQTARIPELISRAWKTAVSGRPGPVVIALPEDMLSSQSDAPVLSGGFTIPEPTVDQSTLDAVRDMLNTAQRPLVLYGGCNWQQSGIGALEQFAEKSEIPVISAFRYIDQFNNHSPVFCGEAGVGMLAYVKDMLRQADVILAINVRFGEMTTAGYSLLNVPEPAQKLIHVHASDSELGKIYKPDIAIQAGANAFARQLIPVSGDWSDWCHGCSNAYKQHFIQAPPQDSSLDMTQVCNHLREVLPDDVIVTNGAGNFAVWPNKFLRYGRSARLLAPQSGAMGYGLPASIAAKHEYPDRTVVCFAGDGDFQMNCQELATAAQYDARPIILLVNNGIYGTIRAHQETHYPERVFGTTMHSPDFVALAKAYGLHAERVENTADFAAAFERAVASNTGALLDLVVAPDAITPFKTIAQLRAG